MDERTCKALFVSELSDALQKYGAGRYDKHLPLTYNVRVNEEHPEWVSETVIMGTGAYAHAISVTGDSLLGILEDVTRVLS